MDSFEINKIIAAVVVIFVVIFGITKISDIIYYLYTYYFTIKCTVAFRGLQEVLLYILHCLCYNTIMVVHTIDCLTTL